MAVAVTWIVQYVNEYGNTPDDLVINGSADRWTANDLPEYSNPNRGQIFLGWYTKDGIRANIGDYVHNTFNIRLGSDTTDLILQLYAKWSFTYFILDNTLEKIANAIRNLTGETENILPEDMASKIEIPFSKVLDTTSSYINKYTIQIGSSNNKDDSENNSID